MTSLADSYTREVYQRLGYLATWLPNVPLKLGQVGVLSRHEFQAKTSLESLGIPFSVSDAGAPAPLSYASEGRVKIRVKGAGEAPLSGGVLGTADAGLTIDMSGGYAVVLQADSSRITQISNRHEVEEEILQRFKNETWPKEWVVLSELVTAKKATVLVSSAKNTVVELAAKGNVPLAALTPASLSAGLELVRGDDLAFQTVAASTLTPMFRAIHVRSRWFNEPVVETREGYKDAEVGQVTVEFASELRS